MVSSGFEKRGNVLLFPAAATATLHLLLGSQPWRLRIVLQSGTRSSIIIITIISLPKLQGLR
jgi:hypothetical protein